AIQCITRSISVYRRMLWFMAVHLLRAEAQVVERDPDQPAGDGQVAEPLKRPFPEPHGPRNARIRGQAAVGFGIGDVVQHVDHAGSAHARRVVHAGLDVRRVFAQLARARFGQRLHVLFGAEVQAPGGAGFDAGRLQPLRDAVRAQRALEHLPGTGIELRDIERAAGDAILAADTILLLEIHDAVLVLHDGVIGGTCGQATGVGAVHALVLAHEPHEAAVGARTLVELDQVPVIPRRLRHGLVGVIEHRLAERQVVPLHAGDLAGLASDAGGGVDQLADPLLALRARARHGAGMTRDGLDAEIPSAHRGY